jgi:glucokinase
MYAVGIDIGGTKIAAALVNAQGQTLHEIRVPSAPQDGTDALIARAAQAAQTLITRADAPVIGVGVGCPGVIDSQRGVVLQAVNLGWHDVPLADGLRAHLGGLPVHVRHDVNTLAHGEHLFGAGRDCDDFALIAVGTGIGFAAFSGGRFITGSGHSGMELGHVALVPNGRACGCGLRGCPEMYVSGVGLTAAAREYLPDYPHSVLTREGSDTPAILKAYSVGDPLAVRIIDEAGGMLATLAMLIAATLNPCRILIGGGLGWALYDTVIERVRGDVARGTLPAAHEHLDIVRAQVESSAVGAAAVAFTQHAG